VGYVSRGDDILFEIHFQVLKHALASVIGSAGDGLRIRPVFPCEVLHVDTSRKGIESERTV
jgi:hypothetical protein